MAQGVINKSLGMGFTRSGSSNVDDMSREREREMKAEVAISGFGRGATRDG